MSKSRSKSLQNLDAAREAVIKATVAMRKAGMKTEHALDRVTPFIGISRRRSAALFFNEATAPMEDAERHQISVGAVSAQRWLADYLRTWADYFDRQADADEAAEQQQWGKNHVEAASSPRVSSGRASGPGSRSGHVLCPGMDSDGNCGLVHRLADR
jgi:hypothetical protein